MNYEQKYKEALARAKEQLDGAKVFDYDNEQVAHNIRTTVYNIFTELKESEDERIRKALISVLESDFENVTTIHGISVGNIIAWLEKQGEQNPDKIVEKAKTEKQRVLLTETYGTANIDWDCRSLDDVKALLSCGLEFIRTIEANKQISADSRFGGCPIRVPTKYDKPTNKVEPKFKVGDWVVFKNRHQSVYQVEQIEDGYYILRHILGGTFRVCVLHDENLKLWKLWTIQDAKDGDVLCTYECGEPKIVFILKGMPKECCALSYHCYYNVMYPNFVVSGSKTGCLAPNDEDVKPATKEQRDLLFQKIKETGYNWDAVQMH